MHYRKPKTYQREGYSQRGKSRRPNTYQVKGNQKGQERGRHSSPSDESFSWTWHVCQVTAGDLEAGQHTAIPSGDRENMSKFYQHQDFDTQTQG